MSNFIQTALISVIIPNYKRVEKLRLALLSVIEQTYNYLEIIVIDDCSPNFERIKEIVNDLGDDRIILLQFDKNRGGGAARNKGISISKGKYIAFLDSDDTWEKTKIEEQFYESEKHNSELLCYTKSTVNTKNWNKIKPKNGIRNNESISEYLFVNNGFLPTPSLFVTTTLAKKCLFDESLPRHQDYDFLFKLENKKVQIIFIDKPLVNVMWTEDRNPNCKGWNSEFSQKFFNNYRISMGEKSYANAFFNHVIYASVKNESRRKSLKYFFKNLSVLYYVKRIVLLKYFIRFLILK